VLYGQVAGARWWIPANLLGWWASWAISALILGRVLEIEGRTVGLQVGAVVFLAFLFGLAAAVAGLITGIVMGRLILPRISQSTGWET
jgi:hypothetical protein